MGNVFPTVGHVGVFMALVLMTFAEIFAGSQQYQQYKLREKWYRAISARIVGMPPPWLFPAAWTLIYVMIIIALYLFYFYMPTPSDPSWAVTAVTILAVINLVVNKSWTFVFFGRAETGLALALIIALLATGLPILVIFGVLASDRYASMWVCFGTFLPYIIWCFYALYLNVCWLIVEMQIRAGRILSIPSLDELKKVTVPTVI